jgi:hypothetical protein
MKRLIINLKKVILIVIVCSLVKCERDVPILEKKEKKYGKLIDTIRLSQAERNIIPYNLNDTIVFRDSLGNSRMLIVNQQHSSFGRYYFGGGTNNATDFYDVEHVHLLLSEADDYTISIYLYAPLPTYVSNQPVNKNKLIILMYGPNDSTDMGNNFISAVDTLDFYYTVQNSNLNIAISYYPTLTVLSGTYNSVYLLTCNQTFPPSYSSYDYPQKLYYNKSQGIVGFRMKNGKRWYLN